LFTIIIATHDRPLLLQRTLASLASQTYQNFTTIIVSDSSQYTAPYDSLAALPGPYKYLLHNEAKGPATSRNTGIRLVDTDYALFLDDDDTLEPTHLQSLANAINDFHGKPETIFFCDFKIIEEDRTEFPPRLLNVTPMKISHVQRENIFVQNIIPNSCLIYPRSVLQAQHYDPSLILFEDWDYLLACLKTTRLHYLPFDSVCIHKSYVEGDENIRRGNVNDEHLVPTTLEIYKRFPAPNELSRQQRIQRFSNMGVQLTEDYL
jgi:glycosyltransferase involved in cell wall biosynthesis